VVGIVHEHRFLLEGRIAGPTNFAMSFRMEIRVVSLRIAASIHVLEECCPSLAQSLFLTYPRKGGSLLGSRDIVELSWGTRLLRVPLYNMISLVPGKRYTFE
jgi:hypothetical protein